MHLVEHDGRSVLLDCGAVRNPRHPGHPHSAGFPFEATALTAAVVSHAHIDHCGHLPALVRHGFRGPIYCTPATRDLLELVLAHSARIQEEDAHVAGIVGRPGTIGHNPLVRRGDVARMVDQCVAVPYEQPLEIADGVELRLVNAGHILGSAMVSLRLSMRGQDRSLTFTGDLGRRESFLLPPPAPIPKADVVVSECTYGGRRLDSPQQARRNLEEVVRRTVERGGKVLVPAFSLGRMQSVVFALRQAIDGGRIPPIPIYVDSALAADLVGIYRKHRTDLRSDDAAVFDHNGAHYLRSPEDSREASHDRGPSVIIAPSGMCEGGRILHHLKLHIDDPRTTVVLVNYQAPHTPGRRLLERGPTVRFHGKKWNKWADIVYLAGFSGHADHDDLLAFFEPLSRRTKVCLVHGELEQAAAFRDALLAVGFRDVAIPARGETVAVDR
jgi:metallo-beta-lactamase family protein